MKTKRFERAERRELVPKQNGGKGSNTGRRIRPQTLIFFENYHHRGHIDKASKNRRIRYDIEIDGGSKRREEGGTG